MMLSLFPPPLQNTAFSTVLSRGGFRCEMFRSKRSQCFKSSVPAAAVTCQDRRLVAVVQMGPHASPISGCDSFL
eukprot:2134441-Pyramimonas_sp.AAC.1